MTTTEPTTGPDIYTAIEALPKVEVSRHTKAMIEDVERVTAEAADVIERATEMYAMHEAQAKMIIEEVKPILGSDHEAGSLNDGLFALMGALSGSMDLFRALQRLSDMANPDNITYEDVIAMREGARLGQEVADR